MHPDTNAPQPNPDNPPPLSPEEAERRARIEYLRSLTPASRPKRRRLTIVILLIIVLLVGAAAGYWFLVRKPAAPSAKTPAPSQETTSEKEESTTTTQTKHHDSPAFSLGFDYLANWSVTDENGKVTVRSPVIQLKAASGSTIKGQTILTIQPKQATLTDFKSGNAIAARESEKISYTKPSPSQRAQTYLSFLSYAGAAVKGIDGIYITGDFGYQKDQAIPMVDIVRVDPLISISFIKCANENCSGVSAPVTISSEAWGEKTVVATAVRTMLTSLVIQ